MFGRRSVIRSSLSAGLCACCSTAFGQHLAKPGTRAIQQIAVCGNGNSVLEFVPDQARISAGSGVPEIDNNLADEVSLLRHLFKSRPSLVFYADHGNPIGALAHRVDYYSTIIYIGLTLISDEMERNRAGWQSAIVGTIAHEWAHSIQYESGFDESKFFFETHADFMAGWYIGVKNRKYGSGVDIPIFAQALFLRGSKKGYFDSDDYGSPEQRVQAMYAGYQYATSPGPRSRLPDDTEAANEGYRYVDALIPRSPPGP